MSGYIVYCLNEQKKYYWNKLKKPPHRCPNDKTHIIHKDLFQKEGDGLDKNVFYSIPCPEDYKPNEELYEILLEKIK